MSTDGADGAGGSGVEVRYRTWQAMVADRARLAPEAVAMSDDLGDQVTYGGLAERVGACAAGWRTCGVGAGDVVAVLGPNSLELIVNALAIASIGALPLMLNWRLTAAELSALGEAAAPVAVVADAEFEAGAAAVCPNGVRVVLDHRAGGEGASMRTSGDLAVEGRGAELEEPPGDVFALLHTSGTTGLPKLIPLTYAGHIWGCTRLTELVGMSAADVHLRFTPLFHLAGLQEIFSALMTGGRTILRIAYDPEQWLDDVAAHHATFGHLPPVTMRRALEAWQERADKPDLSSLREVWYGTAPASPEMVALARQVFACNLRQVYGMTEAQSPVSMLQPEDHESVEHLASAGRPMTEWELRLVDSEGKDVPAGEAGEIMLRGRQLFPGYWGAGLPQGAGIDADGWYRSGDVARLDADGYLFIVDRAKDMIVSGGENIYPAEVEQAVAQHPAVLEVAVVGRPSREWGEQVHAVVVLRPGASATLEEIVADARQRLAGFKVPRSGEIVAELPRNASGKVLKRTLRDRPTDTTEPGEAR